MGIIHGKENHVYCSGVRLHPQKSIHLCVCGGAIFVDFHKLFLAFLYSPKTGVCGQFWFRGGNDTSSENPSMMDILSRIKMLSCLEEEQGRM